MGYEVTELEPLDEGEDATDDRQDVTVSLPRGVVDWLQGKSEELGMPVDEVITICCELQIPAGAQDHRKWD
ncbi:hypothetical protein [Parafrankia irregularis]|uniref:hypothetical protein n=1 Tax=Parafrankia irregularis TaxID=795642 RepID=UPI0010421DCA|nr:hypothetical protein [Parafrankia irregularis]